MTLSFTTTLLIEIHSEMNIVPSKFSKTYTQLHIHRIYYFVYCVHEKVRIYPCIRLKIMQQGDCI